MDPPRAERAEPVVRALRHARANCAALAALLLAPVAVLAVALAGREAGAAAAGGALLAVAAIAWRARRDGERRERTLADRFAERADQLMASELGYRRLVEELPIGVYIDATDEISSNIYTSPQIERLLGYTADEWRESPELFVDILHPDDRQRVLDEVARTNGRHERYRDEYRVLARDGRVVWLRDESILVVDDDGTPLFHQGCLIDITDRKLAEQALLDQQHELERLSAFPRLNPNPVLELTADGTIVYHNDAAERMAESLGRDMAELLPPGAASVVERCLASGEGARLETVVADRTLRVVFFPIEQTRTAHCYVADITERRQSEEALRESEERYRTLVTNVPGAVYRCAADGEWTMQYVSDRIESIAGHPAWEFLGNAVRAFGDSIHPEDRQEVEASIAQAIVDRCAYRAQYRILHADGGVRWVSEQGQPVVDAEGEVLWLDGAIFDVTEQVRAEHELRSTTSLLRTLIENLHSGILVEDDAEVLRYVNGVLCRDLGLVDEPETLIGQPVPLSSPAALAAFLDPDGFRAGLAARRQAGQPVHGEELPLADGRVFERDYVPIRVGERTSHLWQYRDITHRKRAEQELEEQNRQLRALDQMKDEFVALVSHELRTPLTSILGYLELLLTETDELDEQQRHFLGVVERNAQRLLRLVGDLLFVAQMDAGRLTLEEGSADIAGIVSDCVLGQRPRAEARGIVVDVDVANVPPIPGDRARLGQLVDNLLSNAIKFTPDGGSVGLRVVSAGDVVVLEVSDSGIGIPPDEQARLFDRFFRASTATSRQIQGTGLGLTITKAIAEAHGGSISFESSEERGTTFRVGLPAAAAPGARAPHDEEDIAA
ncbi:MAG: PAS domain S-box protein [Thermoleophilia bacterium]